MDARYARGRTALVERRERFYGLGSRLPGHLAPLFPKIQFLKYTKRVSLGTLSVADTGHSRPKK